MTGSAPGIVAVRTAGCADLPAVRGLLADAALPLDGVDEAFEHGIVAEADGRVVGAAAIEPYGADGLLRSVVVAPHQVVRCRVVSALQALVSIDGRDDVPPAVGDVAEVRAIDFGALLEAHIATAVESSGRAR